nr:unnamed protein product [Spirometra erinaceieuropaei]
MLSIKSLQATVLYWISRCGPAHLVPQCVCPPDPRRRVDEGYLAPPSGCVSIVWISRLLLGFCVMADPSSRLLIRRTMFGNARSHQFTVSVPLPRKQASGSSRGQVHYEAFRLVCSS